LWLPAFDENGDAFAPAVNDEFWVWVYALPVSKDNPLHIYERPVDLFEKVAVELGYIAGVDYDATVLAGLTTAINTRCGGDVKLALRPTAPIKASDLLLKSIFGPFRLSTRIVDGLNDLYSFSVIGNAAPATILTIDDLKSDEGTIWDLDEGTVVTSVILKQQAIRLWTSEEREQPEADGLIASPYNPDTIENSADDIPAGLVNEVSIGDIPGMILLDNADPDLIVPLPFEQYLRLIADEIFQRFGRGGIFGEIACLPTVTNQVGEEIIVNLIHRPAADASQSPVSQRGGERRVQIVQRTEDVTGPKLRLCDTALEVTGGTDTGVGGGSEEETDPTGITPADPLAFTSGSNASANWVDSYPQFSTLVQWEAHPPGETTFDLLYGGEHSLVPGVFSDSQFGIGTGWVVRCRYRLTDGAANSNFSGYSNEVTIAGTTPSVPTDVPTNLVATSVVTDEVHAEWVNTNAVLAIRIQYRASVQPSSPTVWGNVAGGTRLLAANTDTDDQPTGAGTFGEFRLQYVNGAGVAGPWSEYSDFVEIMT
jgi:hypothetical protein